MATTCPACKQTLEGATPLGGPPSPLVPEDSTPLPCPGCMALLVVRTQRVPRTNDWEEVVEVSIPSDAVLRVRDRLSRADENGTLGDALAEFHTVDPQSRLVLRIPALAAIARRAFSEGRAALAVPAGFRLQRGSRTSSKEGGFSVSGTWSPAETELPLEEVWPHMVRRFLERPVDPEDPDVRLFPPMLQAWEGFAMLVAGTPLDVLGEDEGFFRVVPRRLAWVKEGALIALRAPIDYLTGERAG